MDPLAIWVTAGGVVLAVANSTEKAKSVVCSGR